MPIVVAAALALALPLCGCFNPFRPEVSTERVTQIIGVAPQPTSSRNVMKLFKWCWDNQNIVEYEKIFTDPDDFRFAFAEADSQGNQFPGRVLTREEEIAIARNLFIGRGAEQPPANKITLEYTSPLIPEPDPRPGKTEPSHVMFQTDVDITIRTDGPVYRILSKALFFAVVWDSANIDIVVERLRIPYNPRRWFIERYEELGAANVVYTPGDEVRARPASNWERVMGATPDARQRPAPAPAAAGTVRWGGLVSTPGTVTGGAAAAPYPLVTWGWAKARYLGAGSLGGRTRSPFESVSEAWIYSAARSQSPADDRPRPRRRTM